MWKDDETNLDKTYDWAEFTLTNGASDYDVRSNIINLWKNIPSARSCIIETDYNITCKFNNTAYPAGKIDVGNSPAEFTKKLEIEDIYLSNGSGNDATIRIWLFL